MILIFLSGRGSFMAVTFELIAPCHFGLESAVKQEIYGLGYDITEVDDGRVSFAGDAEAIVRANMQLRIAERVLLKVGAFPAKSFEELYQGTKALPWEEYLPKDARFWVTKASSVKSQLFSPSDIQSVMKKAMADRMAAHYYPGRAAGTASVRHNNDPSGAFFSSRSEGPDGRSGTGAPSASGFRLPETGAEYPVRVFIKKDVVTAAIDTTGESLHKRGYRKYKVAAPIAENLAAGLIALTPWKPGRILVDPFCGSGTFLIEAAMQSAHIAPGLTRAFTAQSWPELVSPSLWKEVREDLREEIDLQVPCDLQGYDIDRDAIYAARENAKLAGVQDLIHFQVRSVSELSHAKPYGFIITNPPYGERLSHEEEAELKEIYRTLGERYRTLNAWSMYVITSYKDAEKVMGLKSAKNRKIYNGMIQTHYYMFPGPKPGKDVMTHERSPRIIPE